MRYSFLSATVPNIKGFLFTVFKIKDVFFKKKVKQSVAFNLWQIFSVFKSTHNLKLET